MCVEANLNMTHREMQIEIGRKLFKISDYVHAEYTLANGRRADLYAGVYGTRLIVEIKSELKHSLMEAAIKKYARLCDLLVIATPPALMLEDVDWRSPAWQTGAMQRVGIWQVEWTGVTCVRMPGPIDKAMAELLSVVAPPSTRRTVIGAPACTARRP
jgi:hypothetical protein